MKSALEKNLQTTQSLWKVYESSTDNKALPIKLSDHSAVTGSGIGSTFGSTYLIFQGCSLLANLNQQKLENSLCRTGSMWLGKLILVENWSHCPGLTNSDDMPSRGMSPSIY